MYPEYVEPEPTGDEDLDLLRSIKAKREYDKRLRRLTEKRHFPGLVFAPYIIADSVGVEPMNTNFYKRKSLKSRYATLGSKP